MKSISLVVTLTLGAFGITHLLAKTDALVATKAPALGTFERWMTKSSVLNAVVQLKNHVRMFENNLAIRRLLDYKPTKKVGSLHKAFAPFTEANIEKMVSGYLDQSKKDIRQFLNGAAKVSQKNGEIPVTPESATLLRIIPLALKESVANLFSTIKTISVQPPSAATFGMAKKELQKVRADLWRLRGELKKRVAVDHRYVNKIRSTLQHQTELISQVVAVAEKILDKQSATPRGQKISRRRASR